MIEEPYRPELFVEVEVLYNIDRPNIIGSLRVRMPWDSKIPPDPGTTAFVLNELIFAVDELFFDFDKGDVICITSQEHIPLASKEKAEDWLNGLRDEYQTKYLTWEWESVTIEDDECDHCLG
jgi:hypothetical protein